MATLVKLPGGKRNKGNYNKCGKYYVRLWLPDEQRDWLIPCKTSNEREAKRVLKQVKLNQALVCARIQNDLRGAIESDLGLKKAIDLETAIKDFLNDKKGDIADTTISGYRFALNNLMDAIDKKLIITRLEPKHRRLLNQHLIDIGLSKTTQNIRLRGIRVFLNWLVQERYLKELPFEIKMVKQDDPLPKYLTPSEIKRIYSFVDDPVILSAFKVYENTGIRLSELFDSELVDGYLKVMGKGSKERLVPLPSEYVNDYLIASASKYDVFRISKAFTKARRLAGISDTDRKTLHSFRHTYAMFKKLETKDIHAVSKLLGHSSVGVTEKHYTRFDDNFLKRMFKEYNLAA